MYKTIAHNSNHTTEKNVLNKVHSTITRKMRTFSHQIVTGNQDVSQLLKLVAQSDLKMVCEHRSYNTEDTFAELSAMNTQHFVLVMAQVSFCAAIRTSRAVVVSLLLLGKSFSKSDLPNRCYLDLLLVLDSRFFCLEQRTE